MIQRRKKYGTMVGVLVGGSCMIFVMLYSTWIQRNLALQIQSLLQGKTFTTQSVEDPSLVMGTDTDANEKSKDTIDPIYEDTNKEKSDETISSRPSSCSIDYLQVQSICSQEKIGYIEVSFNLRATGIPDGASIFILANGATQPVGSLTYMDGGVKHSMLYQGVGSTVFAVSYTAGDISCNKETTITVPSCDKIDTEPKEEESNPTAPLPGDDTNTLLPYNPATPNPPIVNTGTVTCGPLDGDYVYVGPTGHGITNNTSGLCDSVTMVVNFDPVTLTWKCKDHLTGMLSNECVMFQERCGDGMVNGGEICDGGDIGACTTGQTCDLLCTCTGIKSSDQCGPLGGTPQYTAVATPTYLDPSTPGLCKSGDVVSNFAYNTSTHTWEWECIGPTNDTIMCHAPEERCGDGIVNGPEACDGSSDVCGDNSTCTEFCLCVQHTIHGACGEKHQSTIYSTQSSALQGSDPRLCDDGKLANFFYDAVNYAWIWDCEGIGGGESAIGCFALQERCGDGVRNGNEQCDDGNTASGDGCSKSCSSEGVNNLGPVSGEGCGDADIDLGEQCDDGNLNNNDGCSDTCDIEDGRKCTNTGPSQCGSLECFQHGEWYSEYNIYGQCCGGLTSLPFQHTPDKIIDGAVEMTICYDPDIDEPYCLPFAKTPGRYLMDEGAEKKSLVVKDSCDDVYKDYYQMVYDLLHGQYSYCQYDDEPYERVNFLDINRSPEKSAILALLDHCIVKGRGPLYLSYEPHERINRAEFVKILLKTMFIGYEYYVQPEKFIYNGETYFPDISQDFWGAQYIAKAYELGLLDSLLRRADTSDFMPHKSISSDEIIDIMMLVDAGQSIAPDVIEELFLGKEYPTRAQVAVLMLKKFPSTFRDYLYVQGRNSDYLEQLLAKLKGKHYVDQYRIIVEQIYKLDAEHEHFAGKYDVSTSYLSEYLQSLAR